MSEVFISYKREDEARVAGLAKGLEDAGFSVWWDRGLATGENWRHQIQAALDGAKCVVVVWTAGAVGPAGDFVRDEAGHAKGRGILVPVRLDKVAPPLGFGEVQAVDLTHWKGNPKDPFFADLCASVSAKLDGRPAPAATGPRAQFVRRLTWGGVTSTLGLSVLALFNSTAVQDQVCSLSLQPQISDVCGALGLGHRPTRAERLAWDKRAPGSCSDLRAHIERFSEGAYRARAADMLAARRVNETETWTPAGRRLAMFVPVGGTPDKSEAIARSSALARAQPGANRLCQGFAATTSFRLTSAKPTVQDWECTRSGGEFTCGFQGDVICTVEERAVREVETCGGT